MILWEISSFNRLFRTDVFARIRSRCKDNKHIFAITAIKKVTTEIARVQPSDVYPEDEQELRAKYGVFTPDVSTLYLFEACNTLAMMSKFVTDEEARKYSAYISLGCQLADAGLEDYTKHLARLNKQLSCKTTLLSYRITPADLFTISGMKRNKNYTMQMQKNYPHLNRWAEWIQELHGVEYLLALL